MEAQAIIEIIKQELQVYDDLIEKGKGTWPNEDYVRDSRWHSWHGSKMALRSVLYKIGPEGGIE